MKKLLIIALLFTACTSDNSVINNNGVNNGTIIFDRSGKIDTVFSNAVSQFLLIGDTTNLPPYDTFTVHFQYAGTSSFYIGQPYLAINGQFPTGYIDYDLVGVPLSTSFQSIDTVFYSDTFLFITWLKAAAISYDSGRWVAIKDFQLWGK